MKILNISYIDYFGLLFKAQPVICKWWIWFLFVISDNICHSVCVFVCVCVAFFLTVSACLWCIYAFCNQWQGQAPLIIHLAPTSNICTWKPRSSALCNIFSHILHLNILLQIPIFLEIHSSEMPALCNNFFHQYFWRKVLIARRAVEPLEVSQIWEVSTCSGRRADARMHD